MEENRPKLSISELIAHWKADCGEPRSTEQGTVYETIPIQNRRYHFCNLIQTMLDIGYTKQQISSNAVSEQVINVCWPEEKIKRLTSKKIKQCKKIDKEIWTEAVLKFTHIEISRYKEKDKTGIVPEIQKVENKKEIKKEPEYELNPSDRLIIDNSDIPDQPFDDDILAELAAVGILLDGTKNE